MVISIIICVTFIIITTLICMFSRGLLGRYLTIIKDMDSDIEVRINKRLDLLFENKNRLLKSALELMKKNG